MLSLETARRLKDAGLTWQPSQGDLFAVPDRGLDEQVFVVNDMTTMVERIFGTPAVTFHGTSEWALDYLWLGEIIWLPHEGQLRALLEEKLAAAGNEVYDLLFADGAYTCRFEWCGQGMAFTSGKAAEAYGQALLAVMGVKSNE